MIEVVLFLELNVGSKMSSKLCVLCKNEKVNSKFSRLFAKGFKTLIEKCSRKDLNNLRNELIEIQNSEAVSYVHINCRKQFTFQRKSAKSPGLFTELRSSNIFNYKTHCFLCEKQVFFRNRQRDKLRFVET